MFFALLLCFTLNESSSHSSSLWVNSLTSYENKVTRISVQLQKRCNLLDTESRINKADCHSPPTLLNGTLHTLTKINFLIHTVSYRPSFPPSIYGPSAKRPGHKSKQYGTVWTMKTRLVRYLFLLCVWWIQEHFCSSGMASNFWTTLKAKQVVRFEIVFKSLAVGNKINFEF